jgi:hypothetical protein
MLNALLVRVGADQSAGGGHWNGAINGESREFVYVAIPESAPLHSGYEQPYLNLSATLESFGHPLPPHLLARYMHLDPDFGQLTYGDQGERGRQLRARLQPGDWLVFYASLVDVRRRGPLVYALIGLLVVDRLVDARDVPPEQRHVNAHARRVLPAAADDVVVVGRAGVSGRLRRCLPIGEWRAKAYRVRMDLLEIWGGLSVNDGWLQRSARLPRFLAPERFQSWFAAQEPELIAANNP